MKKPRTLKDRITVKRYEILLEEYNHHGDAWKIEKAFDPERPHKVSQMATRITRIPDEEEEERLTRLKNELESLKEEQAALVAFRERVKRIQQELESSTPELPDVPSPSLITPIIQTPSSPEPSSPDVEIINIIHYY
jgi:hypothetical protein